MSRLINAAKAIKYGDKDVVSIFYCGRFGNYHIWPNSAYVTELYVVELSNLGEEIKRYQYSYDQNFEPEYIDHTEDKTFTGLSPNRWYAFAGTMMINNQEIEDCWFWNLTGGDDTSNSSVFTVINSDSVSTFNSANKTKYNPIMDSEWKYGVFKMNTDWTETAPKWDAFLGYGDKQVGAKLGENQANIFLKRTDVHKRIHTDYSHAILGLGDVYTFECYRKLWWYGPHEGSEIDDAQVEIYGDYDKDVLDINYSNNKVTIECKNAIAGQENYNFIIRFDEEDEISFDCTVNGPSYRIFESDQISPNGEISITSPKLVTIHRALSMDDIMNGDYTEIANFELTSENRGVVYIDNNNNLIPVATGTSEITVTDKDYGISFVFTCNVEVNEDTYVEIIVNTTSGSPTVLQRCLLNDNIRYATIPSNAIGIGILFYAGETGNVLKDVYFKADKTISGWHGIYTSWSYSPTSTISLGGSTTSAGTSTFIISSTNNDDGIIGRLQLTFNK